MNVPFDIGLQYIYKIKPAIIGCGEVFMLHGIIHRNF